MNSWCRGSRTETPLQTRVEPDLEDPLAARPDVAVTAPGLAHGDLAGSDPACPDPVAPGLGGEAADRPDPALLPAPELPLALLGALRRFGPAWLRWMGAHVGVGITPARLQLLGALAASHAPQIMRQLTTVLGTTPRAVTSLVDGLETDGLVARSAHPTDRRATLVSLTARGRELTEQRHAQGVLAAARVFDVLPESDQRALLRILQTLTDALTTPR